MATSDARSARHEDVRWMAETGENLDGAARRLEMTAHALERWLWRNDRESLQRLLARQPRDHNRLVMQERPSINEITGQGARRQATRARARARAHQEAA